MPSIHNVARIILTQTGKDQKHDVNIRIRVNSYDEFSIQYTENESGHKARMEFDWDTLLEYLSDVFALLAKDEAPFESVQIQIPGMPLVALPLYEADDEDTFEILTNSLERFVEQVCEQQKQEEW